MSKRFLDLRMDVASFCNLRCIMCYLTYTDKAPHLMEMDLFRKIAREVFPKTRVLVLSWATEPLVHRDIAEMVAIAKNEYGIPQVTMITNATLLSSELSEQFASGGLDKLYISMDGATKATYEQIRINGNFDRVVRNLEHLRDHKKKHGLKKPREVFNYAMMNRNVEELPDFVTLVHRLGGREINAFGIEIQSEYLEVLEAHRKGDLPEEQGRLIEQLDLEAELISVDEPKVSGAITEARRRARRLGVYLYTPRLPGGWFSRWPWLLRRIGGKIVNMEPGSRISLIRSMLHFQLAYPRALCFEPWHRLAIYSNGDVQPCCLWPLETFGSFREQSFDEIWSGEGYVKLREALAAGRPPEVCVRCSGSTRMLLS